MKYSILLFIVLAKFLVTSDVSAQPFIDIANVSYQESHPTNLLRHDKQDLKTKLFSASLNLPVKLGTDYLIFNPHFEQFNMSSGSQLNDKRIYAVYMPVAYLMQLKNKNWNTTWAILPRINSDLEYRLASQDMQTGIAVLNTFEKKSNLKYTFGIYYNNEFFGPFIIPLVGIDWNVNSRLNIFGNLPNSMNLEYKFSNKLRGGCSLLFMTNSYRILHSGFLRIDDNHVKTFLDYYLAKSQVLTLEIGHSVLRKYRSGIRENGNTEYFDEQVSNGILFRIGYSFRLRLDEPKK